MAHSSSHRITKDASFAKMRIRNLLLAMTLWCGAGCGSEIGRIVLNDVGTGEKIVSLRASQRLDLWTQLDVTFSERPMARYDVALIDASGAIIATASCNPFNTRIRLNSVRQALVLPYHFSYQGKMIDCRLSATKAGNYTVRASLSIPMRPAELLVRDMSLVLKLP
jgi:hypothetical protein